MLWQPNHDAAMAKIGRRLHLPAIYRQADFRDLKRV